MKWWVLPWYQMTRPLRPFRQRILQQPHDPAYDEHESGQHSEVMKPHGVSDVGEEEGVE